MERVAERYYRGGEFVSHLLSSVFLCGGFVMGKVKDIFQDQRERASKICPECDGDGKVVEITYRVQSFSRDVGEVYEDPVDCETCQGEGAVFVEEDDEDL